MKTFLSSVGNILGFLIVVALVWHAKVFFFNPKTPIAGVFKVKPKTGYTWGSSTDSEPRYFWDETNVAWHPGYRVPDYNMTDDEKENMFDPLPGYSFIAHVPGDFRTVWTPGLRHPTYHAMSSSIEGTWKPDAGYKFRPKGQDDSTTVWYKGLLDPTLKVVSSENEGRWRPFPGYRFVTDTNLDVTWNPGRSYDTLKVFSADTQDDYYPYPGYEFAEDTGKSLHVVWKSGLQNYLEPQKTSSEIEGVWNIDPNYQPPSNREKGFCDAVFAFGIGLLNEKVTKSVGDNPISSAVDEGAKKTFFNGLGQMITGDSDDPFHGIKPNKKHITW